MNFLTVNVVDDEVNNRKGENHDDETDNAVKNGVFSLFDLSGITGGSHILNATKDDDNDGQNTKNTNDDIEDVSDIYS